jgi:tetrahydromethanopterin S-methyltransferase subunit F
MKTLEDFLKELKFKGPREFHPGVVVDPENKRIDIYLEDVSYHSEWIKGEGGDIGLYRAMDDNRVIGAALPLNVWKGKFPILILDKLPEEKLLEDSSSTS